MSFSIYCAIRCEHGLGILDLNSGGGQNPAIINMGDSSRTNQNQQWRVMSYQGSSTRVIIQHPASGRLVYTRGKNENVGCDYLGEGDVRTHWILEAEDGPVDLQQYRGQKIRFKNESDGFYIDLWEAKNEDRTPIKCGDKSGNNQNFKLISYWV